MLISQDAKGREGYSPRFDPAMSMDYDTLASLAQCIWGFWHHGGARARTVNTWCHFHVEPFFGWLSDLQTRGGFLSCSLAHFMEDIFPRGRQTSGYCQIKILNNYSEWEREDKLFSNLQSACKRNEFKTFADREYFLFFFPISTTALIWEKQMNGWAARSWILLYYYTLDQGIMDLSHPAQDLSLPHIIQ